MFNTIAQMEQTECDTTELMEMVDDVRHSASMILLQYQTPSVVASVEELGEEEKPKSKRKYVYLATAIATCATISALILRGIRSGKEVSEKLKKQAASTKAASAPKPKAEGAATPTAKDHPNVYSLAQLKDIAERFDSYRDAITDAYLEGEKLAPAMRTYIKTGDDTEIRGIISEVHHRIETCQEKYASFKRASSERPVGESTENLNNPSYARGLAALDRELKRTGIEGTKKVMRLMNSTRKAAGSSTQASFTAIAERMSAAAKSLSVDTKERLPDFRKGIANPS